MGTAHAHLTDCGLSGIRKVPYGLHACHFYSGAEQLVEALVPFFLAGLYNGEKCLWVAAPPLPATEARAAMQSAWSGTQAAVERGALRIVDFADWYGEAAVDAAAVVDAWLTEEAQALARGYRGLRISGNTSFLKRADWKAFMEYERLASERFSGRRIIALCSYALDGCDAGQAMEVVRAHGCAFDRPDAGWQVLSAGAPTF